MLDLLDLPESDPVGTSVRIPESLRKAAVAATELGFINSTTDATVQGLRSVLEGLAQRAILEAHYEQHPGVRPTLAEVAQATAELDGNGLARQPKLIASAAVEVTKLKQNASPDDVLLYAAALANSSAA